jgi:hypothetical protein
MCADKSCRRRTTRRELEWQRFRASLIVPTSGAPAQNTARNSPSNSSIPPLAGKKPQRPGQLELAEGTKRLSRTANRCVVLLRRSGPVWCYQDKSDSSAAVYDRESLLKPSE